MSLVDKLKKCLKKPIHLISTISLTIPLLLPLSGCPIPPELENNPPKAIINVFPTSGQTPLETKIQLDGNDLDGKEDIVNYQLTIDREGIVNDELITQEIPINITRTFDEAETIKIYGQCTDSSGAIGKTDNVYLKVVQEPDINLPPSVDLSSVNKDLLEETEQTIDLPPPIDPNQEDNPVPYTTHEERESADEQVTSRLEGDVLNGYQLIIKGKKDATGFYQIELEFGTPEGGINTKTLEGVITNLPDISGQLQNNETDSPQSGIIKVYKKLDDVYTKLKEIPIDSSGDFNFQLDEVVSEIALEAKLDVPSYFRIVRLDGAQDYDLTMRVVSYDGPLPYDDELINYPGHSGQITPVEFKTFMEETNFLGATTTNNNPGLKKLNFGELPDTKAHPIFKGIKIVDSYNGYSFSNPEGVKTILKNSVYPRAEEIDISIITQEQMPNLTDGWGIVVQNSVPGAGRAITYDYYGKDGYIEGFFVEIDPFYESDSSVWRHEVFGHGINYPSPTHTTIPGSIMYIEDPPLPPDFTAMDIKGSYIVDEENYEGMESSDDIIGMSELDNPTP